MWSTIKQGLKVFGLGLVFFLVFLIFTFPFQRLGPKLATQIERILNTSLGMQTRCTLTGFNFSFPIGIRSDQLSCTESNGNTLVQFENWKLTLLPSYQSFSSEIQGGKIHLTMNAGFASGPTLAKAELTDVPLKSLSPLIGQALSRVNPMIRDLKFEGLISGNFNIPLKDFVTRPGSIDLDFKALKLPGQPALNLIGLKELPFSKATIKAAMSAGKLSISDIQFISEHLSGKVEGSMELNDEFQKSIPNITLKWNVRRSDALLSTPIGIVIANAPCPNQDTQGFCSKRLTRMEDFTFRSF